MAEDWEDIPLESEMFQNLDESVLRRAARTLENAFINEAKGHSRFPGLKIWTQLPSSAPVFINHWRQDMIAVTGGRIFRLDMNKTAEDITVAIPGGGKRVTFARTENQLAIAAGGDIVQVASSRSELLSSTAPQSTHIAYLSGYLLAIEKDSQRFYHSVAGEYRVWNAIDVFAAESRPDLLTALLVTEFGEALLGGPESIEQYEPFPGGDAPFFRRWTVGEGLAEPYTLIAADNGIWGLNRLLEFVRFSGQTSKPESTDIGLLFESLDDRSNAWAALLHLIGQKFIILTFPNATNAYGTQGVTLLYDYRERRWSFLFGWDAAASLPGRWPGNSIHALWGQHFVGGYEGQIYTLDRNYFANNEQPQIMRWRSAHYDQKGKVRIDNLRFRLRRGAKGNTEDLEFRFRTRRDNRHWQPWQVKKLGREGDTEMYLQFGGQGIATTWQFEYWVSQDAPVEVTRAQAITTRVD